MAAPPLLWRYKMKDKKQPAYIAPPKLQQQFLLAGLSVPDIGIMLLLFFGMIFLGQLVYGVFFPLCYGAFVARILDGKSIRDYLLIFLRYHYDAQQYTQHIETATKRRPKRGRKK